MSWTYQVGYSFFRMTNRYPIVLQVNDQVIAAGESILRDKRLVRSTRVKVSDGQITPFFLAYVFLFFPFVNSFPLLCGVGTVTLSIPYQVRDTITHKNDATRVCSLQIVSCVSQSDGVGATSLRFMQEICRKVQPAALLDGRPPNEQRELYQPALLRILTSLQHRFEAIQPGALSGSSRAVPVLQSVAELQDWLLKLWANADAIYKTPTVIDQLPDPTVWPALLRSRLLAVWLALVRAKGSLLTLYYMLPRLLPSSRVRVLECSHARFSQPYVCFPCKGCSSGEHHQHFDHQVCKGAT